ncbi:MAG: NACHT domain-containing protein, partial [Alphaproteobacteria bacterium]
MELPSEMRARLGDHLPPAACRLLEIILRSAIVSAANPLEMSANKDMVLTELAREEGSRPDDGAVRQRLQTIRTLLKTDTAFRVNGQPCLTVKSSKYAFLVTWAEGAREKLGLAKTREAVIQSGHDDYRINMGQMEPVTANLAVSAHEILLSHKWENRQINEILDDFVKDLQAKLANLPAKYAGKFTAKLLYDRNGDMHGRAMFYEQIDRLCTRAAMAVFMTSNGWIGSPACQREARHFKRRCEDGKDNPFVHVQLCDDRSGLPEEYLQIPIYPSVASEFGDYSNLLELWVAPAHIRDRFVAAIRDQICEFLLTLPGPPESPEGSTSPNEAQKLKDWLARSHHAPDVATGKRIRAHLTADEGDDRAAPTEGRLLAVDTLYGWATNPDAESRMLVLLGGFGMGKTTTVQLLHERLRDDLEKGREVPTPVYLDFRRLIPATEPGKAIKATLADLVASSLHADARNIISGDKVIDLIRSDRCVVIFDGLDEVGNRIGREYAIQLFRQFLELIPADVQAAEARKGKADWNACQTRLILTCRTHFFRTLRQQNSLLSGAHRRSPQIALDGRGTKLPGIDTYYMAPLTLEQIAELFERHLGKELGRSTFGLIRGIHDLPGLAARPIMARFISEVAGQLIDRHTAGRPINIATIYEELFQLTLERDAEKRPLMSAADRRDMLCALATHFHCEGVSARSADDLERWFDGFAASHSGIMLTLRSGTADTRGLLHTELENASLLVRGGGDRFSFAHTSYYEYFLALALFSVLFSAGTGESLAAFCARPISRETMAFIEAIAVRDGREAELVARWKDILRSNAEMPTRRLAFDMLRRSGMDPFVPGANLADFDLRGYRIDSGARVARVNFAWAGLSGLDARQATFRDCDFDRAILANARLDGCRFE